MELGQLNMESSETVRGATDAGSYRSRWARRTVPVGQWRASSSLDRLPELLTSVRAGFLHPSAGTALIEETDGRREMDAPSIPSIHADSAG